MHSLPLTRDLVLIGGGHAHALLLRRWGMRPLPGARVTLISPAPTAPYTGMLPGHIAGHYPRAALEIDLVHLARHAGARLILERATGLDRAAGRVLLSGRAPVGYDVVSIDIGITAAMPDLPGFAAHAVPVKPLDAFATAWEAFLARPAGDVAAGIVVIGGGVAGVEIALAMAHRLHGLGRALPVTVLEAGAQALAGLGPGARRALSGHARRLGVTLRTGARPEAVEAGAVVLDGGTRLPAALVVGAAGARPHGWLADTGLPLTDGFLTVDAYLRSTGDAAVFAAGDCAHMAGSPRPKAGVFAVRQAPVLWQNLRAALGAGPRRPFRPQRDFLKLVSTGGKGAVAEKWGLALDGGWLWRLKNRIDARFMERLAQLPAMPRPALPAEAAAGLRAELAGGAPLCGGCGAKLGARALAGALAALPPPARADLLAGPGDDAAILRHGAGVQVLTTDHLRAVTEDAGLMARIAAVHALGDVWAMGAAPQVALAAVTLPRMAEALQRRTLEEILAAAAEVFAAEGAAIAGGHSMQGAELVLGFTVTGLAGHGIAKAGARPGDAVVLTKPLGTGILLAAGMAGAASGDETAAAWAHMARPQGTAARLLAPVAHAMTDVTGFGLAGHLIELLDASGTAAEIDLAALPALPGAAALSARHRSILAPANAAALEGRAALPEGPAGALLLDPQTSGGLLAAVPAEAAEGLVAALRAEGFVQAAVIGRVTNGPPRIAVIGG